MIFKIIYKIYITLLSIYRLIYKSTDYLFIQHINFIKASLYFIAENFLIKNNRNPGERGTKNFRCKISSDYKCHLRFLTKIIIISANANCNKGSIQNIELITEPGVQMNDYIAIARLLPGRINIDYCFTDKSPINFEQNELDDLLNDSVVKSFIKLDVGDVINSLRPRKIHENKAMEYIKAIDPYCRYLAISYVSDEHLSEILNILKIINVSQYNWRVLLVGPLSDITSITIPVEIIFVGRLGFSFSMMLSFVSQADAFFGGDDVFSLFAAISNKPSIIHSSGDEIISCLKLLDNVKILNDDKNIIKQSILEIISRSDI